MQQGSDWLVHSHAQKHTASLMGLVATNRSSGGGGGVVNSKGADQPAQSHRLISAFVIRLLKSIIAKLASSEISL